MSRLLISYVEDNLPDEFLYQWGRFCLVKFFKNYTKQNRPHWYKNSSNYSVILKILFDSPLEILKTVCYSKKAVDLWVNYALKKQRKQINTYIQTHSGVGYDIRSV